MGIGQRETRHNYGSSISPRYTPHSYETPVPVKQVKDPNPDPYNFRVLFEKRIGKLLVAMVLYPDATNYEGVKVLVLKDLTTLKDLKELDPHFFPNGALVARFLPTEEGWEHAQKFATMLMP